MAPTIKFRAKNKGGNLVITVVSCTDLPDADAAGVGFGNKSDPYVVVRVGGEEQKTRALGGTLNPEFKKDTSTFTFDVRSAFRILYYRQFHHILQHSIDPQGNQNPAFSSKSLPFTLHHHHYCYHNDQLKNFYPLFFPLQKIRECLVPGKWV